MPEFYFIFIFDFIYLPQKINIVEKFVKKLSSLFLGVLFIARTIEEVALLSEKLELKVWDESTSSFKQGEIRVGDTLVSSVEQATADGKIPVRLLRVSKNTVQGWILSNPVELLDIQLYALPLSAVGDTEKTLKFVKNRQTLGLYPVLEFPMTSITAEGLSSANIKNGKFILNDREVAINSVEDMRTALSMPSRRENQIVRFFVGTGELVLPEIVKNAPRNNTNTGTTKTSDKPKSELEILREKLLEMDEEMFASPEVTDEVAETTPEVATTEMTTEVTAETPQLTAAQKKQLEKAAKTVDAEKTV